MGVTQKQRGGNEGLMGSMEELIRAVGLGKFLFHLASLAFLFNDCVNDNDFLFLFASVAFGEL